MGKNELMMVVFVLSAWAEDVEAARANVRDSFGYSVLFEREKTLREWTFAVDQERRGGAPFSPSYIELECLKNFCVERGQALCMRNMPFIDFSKEWPQLPKRDPRDEAICLCAWANWNQERLGNHEC